jgi:hypothetical protein
MTVGSKATAITILYPSSAQRFLPTRCAHTPIHEPVAPNLPDARQDASGNPSGIRRLRVLTILEGKRITPNQAAEVLGLTLGPTPMSSIPSMARGARTSAITFQLWAGQAQPDLAAVPG